MSLKACIPGYLPATDRAMLEKSADRWSRYHKGDRGKAEVSAVRSALEQVERKRLQIAMSAKAESRLADGIANSGDRPGEWLESQIRTSARGIGAGERSIEAEQGIANAIANHKMAGFRDLAADTPRKEAEAVSADLLRELSGIDTGNAAVKAAAKSLREGLDWLKQTFNNLGGEIKTRGNYLLPQTWDAARIREASGRDTFIERMAAYYEKPGVMDPLLGPHGAPLDGDELRGALADIHDSIAIGSSRGTIGQVAGAMRGRHLDPRSISFRDVEARIEAAGLFGNPNAFDVVDAHVRAMTQEIGTMRVFGPHPDLAYVKAREAVQRRGYGGRGPASETKLAWLDDTYRHATGVNDRPASAGIAVGGDVVRSAMSGGLLPLALVSQLSDVVPISLASSIFGVPQLRAITQGIQQFAGAGLSRSELTRIGVVVDGMIAQLANSGALDTIGRVRRFNEATMRFYGIKRWQESMQGAAEATMLGRLAELRGLSLADADAASNGMLGKLGWTDEAWDILRRDGIEDIRGASFASVGALEKAGASPEVAAQLVYTAQRFGNLALTVPDIKTRAMLAMGTQKGTIAGEAARASTQFKSFGTQFFINQLGQIMQLPTNSARVGYATKLLAGSAALGMASLQIKRLLKGQELADMTEHRTQFSAIMQGGGFGVVGDFFNTTTQQSRFGHGLITTLAGPAFGAAEDVAALTLGNIGQAARGEQANFGSEAIRLGGKYVPFANAPFMGVAFQRLAVDQARLWADPSGSRRSFMSMEQRQREEFNSKYWWRPGATTPELAR